MNILRLIGQNALIGKDAPLRTVRAMAARVFAMIRIDAVWLSTVPLDMRAGTDTALARVVAVFGAAQTRSLAGRSAPRGHPSRA